MSSKKRILVIEDENRWREQFRDILLREGYRVDTAKGTKDAKKLLNKHAYALVLLDVALDQDYFDIACQEFCDYLHQQYPETPVVATTGKRLEPPEMWTLSQLCVVEFIYKPEIKLSEFRRCIQNLLKKSFPDQSNTTNFYQYDVFISYSHHDKDWVRNRLLRKLEKEGVRVCIDFRDFTIGGATVSEIERALSNSYRTLLILTPNYLRSAWAEFENVLLQTLDLSSKKQRIIPILLKECELPIRIRALNYLNFTGNENEKIQFKRLITAIK